MKTNQLVATVVALAVFSAALVAHAGQVLLSYDVAARYDEDFNSLPFNWSPGEAIDNIDDGPGIYQVDMFLQTVNLQPGERGFAAMSFDALLNPEPAFVSKALDYQPDVALTDSNGAAPGGIVQKWATNTDGGDPTDWKGILVAVQAGPLQVVDPRRTIGDPDPEYFGSFYVRWNALGAATLTFDNFQYSISDNNGVFGSPQIGPDLVLPFDHVFVDPMDIVVSGNGLEISRGDVTPSLLDNTDFGEVHLGDPNVQREFSLDCFGLCGAIIHEPVLTGPYSIVGDFPDVADGPTSFTIALDPGLPRGDYPGSITIPYEGSDGNSYSFNLFARVVPEPTSVVLLACGFAIVLVSRFRNV